MLPVNQLRAFVAVVEAGTVTAASAAIGRTQPQVSRLVSGLEEAVGFALFVRENRRLLLTQRGARFYDEARHVLESLNNIGLIANGIRDDVEPGPRILAPAYISQTILPRALAAYRKRFPKRHFTVEIVARNAIGSWLPFRPFDIAIAALPFELPATKVRQFASMQTVVVLPPHHPLLKHRSILLTDVAKYPFIAAHPSTAIRQRIDKAFALEGLKPAIVGDTSNSLSACDMVAAGLGITIADALVPLTRGYDNLETRPWKPGSATTFGFIYPSATSNSTIGEEFSVFVEDAVREL